MSQYAGAEAATWNEAAGAIPDQIQSSGRSESTRYYRPELDCLRFIAFFYVFVRHVWQSTEFGTADLSIPPILVGILQPIIAAGLYGVDVFFALSAFLITKLLLLERDRTGAVHVRSFYLRRILRIWPLYFAFVLLLMPYEVLAVGVRLKYYASLFTFTQNWYCSWNTVVESTLTLALWSVCVEEQFYLVWPFLIGCSKRLRNIGLLLCCVFAFTCLYRVYYVSGPVPHPGSMWGNTFTRLDPFALGGLLALLLHKRDLVCSRLIRYSAIVLGLGLFWYLGTYPEAATFDKYPLWSYPMAAAASVLWLFAFATAPPRAEYSRLFKAFSYLGKISYGLYVFHWPAMALWIGMFSSFHGYPITIFLARTTLALLTTLALAMASYTWLEKPFLSLKQRFTYVPSRVD